jgi:fatty acid desaturase
MALLRYEADRIPVAIITTYFVADLAVFLTAKAWWVPVLWFVIGVFPKGWVSAFGHHHQHVHFFKKTWLNRLFELGLGLQTGIVTNTWVLHHVLGHHVNYLDQTKDESRWTRDDGTVMGVAEYTLITAATAYPRAWVVGARYPKVRRGMIGGIVATLAVLALLFSVNAYNALWVYVIPMIATLTATAWVTYYHHANFPTNDAMDGCTNVLDPIYNLLTGNLGYHSAHHHRQNIHWSKLPELHAQLADKIPPQNFLVAGAPVTWIRAGLRLVRPARRPSPAE